MKGRVSELSKTRPMFRSSPPLGPSSARASGRGPSGTVFTANLSAPLAGQVIPGTAPVPDFTRDSPRGVRAQAPRAIARDTREPTPAALRRLNKCMFLEYDERENRWRDALNRTGRQPSPQVALKPRREEARHAAQHPASAAREPLPALPMGPPLWENPVVVGLLLAVCPPVGVTLAWSARSIPHSGRVALTMFGGFVMLTATLIACLLLTG